MSFAKDFLLFINWPGVKAPKPQVPLPLTIAVEDLAQAQRDLLHHHKVREFEEGMVEVLEKRVRRLKVAVTALAREVPKLNDEVN